MSTAKEVGALGGTALGGFIAANPGLVYGVGAVYFMIGIGLSLYLLKRGSAGAGAPRDRPLANRARRHVRR